MADVAGWAEAMRAERLNETGRAAIDLVELAVETMLRGMEDASKRIRALEGAISKLGARQNSDGELVASAAERQADRREALLRCTTPSDVVARVLPTIEKQMRVAFQADHNEGDRHLAWLRIEAERQESADKALDGMH